jgi:hypothetical protein
MPPAFALSDYFDNATFVIAIGHRAQSSLVLPIEIALSQAC